MLQNNFDQELRQSAPLQSSPSRPKPDGLGDTLRLFRRHRFGLMAWIGFCVVVTAFYAVTTPKEFVATTQLILDSRRLSQGIETSAYAPMTIDNPQVESQVQIARSEQVLRLVFRELNLGADPEFGAVEKPSLLSRLFSGNNQPQAISPQMESAAFAAFSDGVVARRVGQSLVLEISFRSRSAERSAKIANAIAASFIHYQLESRGLEMRRSGDWLQSRIDDLQSQEQATIDAIHNGVAPKGPLTASPVQIISEASEPLHKTYPQTTLLLASAFTFALLTGLGYLTIKHGFDRSINSRRQIAEGFEFECLGGLPYESLLTNLSPSALLAFMRNRPNAGFVRTTDSIVSAILSDRIARTPRLIGIVSCHPKAGTSTIAAALAIQIAARGHTTALADLSPRISERLWRFDLGSDQNGVAHAPVAPAGTEIQIPPQLQFLDLVGFCVAGREASPRRDAPLTFKLRDRLKSFEQVVIDFPALSESSDALRHASLLDGVIVVVEYGKTSADQLSDIAHAFYLADTPIIGVIMNREP